MWPAIQLKSRQRSGRARGRRGDCSTNAAISPGDPTRGRKCSRPCSLQTTRAVADHAFAPNRTASGCAWRSPCPGIRSGPARPWQVQVRPRKSCTCSTANDAGEFPRPIAGSPASCMAAGPEGAPQTGDASWDRRAGGFAPPPWASTGSLSPERGACGPSPCWSAPAFHASGRRKPFAIALAVHGGAEPLHHPHGPLAAGL